MAFIYRDEFNFMKNIWLFFFLLIKMAPAYAAAEESESIPKEQSSIEYTKPDSNLSFDSEEEKVYPRIESFINNREILLQLNQGADLLNNSLDTLMESLFYHLLDHSFYHNITEDLFLTISSERQLFSTEFGAYVVMDKIQYGPEYYKQIGTIHGLDVFLGAKAGVNLLDIRLRTDAQRITEANELSPYRYFVNNWLGLLPLLEKILPPSFNANELYDPLQQVEAPFRFPMTEAVLESMPIGTIRSYSLTGGVSIPFNFLSYLKNREKNILSNLNIETQLPYAVFVQGEHRINVLKKSNTIFWVGVSETERFGHSVSALLGKTFYFLKNSIQPIPWNGIAVLLAPLQYEWSDALVHNFDHLYEFDVQNPKAKSAYFKAVAGDFRDAVQFQKTKEATGVRYHFTKNRDANETITESSRNFILFRQSRSKNVTKAEIQLIEPEKTSYFLEGTSSIQDEDWNVLVGKRSSHYEFLVDMQVDKLSKRKSLFHGAAYKFYNEHNKYQARVNLKIQDRYMDAGDYANYIETLRKFSQLSISNAPTIPLFAREKQDINRRQLYFHSPMTPPITPHVVETELGKFSATGTLYLSFPALSKIIQTPSETQWNVLADAYELRKAHPTRSRTSTRYAEWIKKGLTYPARVVNERYLWGDGVLEVAHLVNSLEHLRKASTPLDTLHGFYDLFNLDYPSLALDGLLRLLEVPPPVKILFAIDPNSSVEPGIRKNLLDLNRNPISSSQPLPPPKGPLLAKEKLQAFFPTHLQELRDHPVIASISIYMSGSNKKEIRLRIKAMNTKPNVPLQLFLQLEEGGKYTIAKRILNQKIISILPILEAEKKFSVEDLSQQTFEVWLSGPQCPLTSIDYDAVMEVGGTMLIRMAISADGTAWSEKKVLSFKYRNHKLFPPE